MSPTRRSKIIPQKKPRRRYTHAVKRDMIIKLQTSSTRELEDETGIPKSNLSLWMKQAPHLLGFGGPMRRFNLGGPEEIPDTMALEAYMHKLRTAERAVTCTHLVNFLKRNHQRWLEDYLATKNCGYQSLLKLLQRFCARHGFTRQKPAKTKRTQEDL
ncbi:hypothetical protein As57867_003852, partial [Aphanomyces stellatus]